MPSVKKSTFGFGLAALAALFVLAAQPGTARALTTLRVGKAVPDAFTFVPLDVGIKEGIFAKHGIKVQEFAFGGDAKMQQALIADSLDIGIGSGPALAFVAKGSPVLGVAAMASKPSLLCVVVKKDGPIHTVADLKGKIVSSSTPGSLTTWLVTELSRKEGWGPDGIQHAYLGSTPPQLAALETGSTQGATVQIATGYKLEQQGVGRILFQFGDIVPNFIMHVIFARKALIAKDPQAIREFLAGWFDTIHYMQSHKAEVVKIAVPIMHVSPEIAGRSYDELMPIFSHTGKFEPAALKVLANSFVEMHLLPKAPDMQKLYTEKFLPGASS